MILLLAIIFGLVVGSFLNVVIYRLHAGIGFVRGRSHCPHCRHDLRAADLIPLVSFLALRGKCRYCRKPISWQYPLVEAGTACCFGILYWWFGIAPSSFVYLLYTVFLIVIFVYDFRYYLILDVVSIPLMVAAALLSYFVLGASLLSLLAAAVMGGGFFLVQYLVSKGKWIGGGDIRLGAAMGLMLGWQQLLIALFMAYVLGSCVGIGLVLFGRKKWQSQVPFGTFLSVATFLTFLCGTSIVNQYFHIWI